MARLSAGILLFRRVHGSIEVLLVHPGGPFWAHKDLGCWSIPKGEYGPDEDAFAAALRELREEIGLTVSGDFRTLTPLKQPGGKLVSAWAIESDSDVSAITSNTFHMEWPPRSGIRCEFPEIDRAEWFPLQAARSKILKGQAPFLDELAKLLDGGT